MKAITIILCLVSLTFSHPVITAPIEKIPVADGSFVHLSELAAVWKEPRAVRLELHRGDGQYSKQVYSLVADYEDGTPKFYTMRHGTGANKVTVMMYVETVGFKEYAQYKTKFDAWQVDGDSAKYKAALEKIREFLRKSNRIDKVIVKAREEAEKALQKEGE